MNNDPYSGFMGTFSKVVDTLILSILWLICSIPVITIGAASSSFYQAYHKAIRQDRGYACKTFFSAFKENFKQATGIWLIILVFMSMSLIACYWLWRISPVYPIAMTMLLFGSFLMLLVLMWSLYVFAYQCRFENTMLTVMKNAALIAFSHLLWTLLLFVIFAAAAVVVILRPFLSAPVIAIYVWLANRILERIFRKLMTPEELQSELEWEKK